MSKQPARTTIETGRKTEQAVKPCSTCLWSIREGNGLHRCHVNPPQIRLPYDNLAAWPVVPTEGGGCRLWEERK